MAKFERGMGEKLVKALSKHDLFKSKLMEDIQNGKVFFAIRPGYGSFYVKGRSLFKYKSNRFSSHQKFVFIPKNSKGSYINEKDLKNLVPISDFVEGYERIKERAERYADPEATGVSALYKFAPHTGNLDERYFLVDIEVGFDAANDTGEEKGERKADRIDILLYDNELRNLLFCEAKHYSNAEIKMSGDAAPKVLEQLTRYDGQIKKNKKAILAEYTKAFKEYNALMGTKLNPPKDIVKKCGLYIFGFNRSGQQELRSCFDKNKNFYGRKCKIIGKTDNDTVEKIYKSLI